MQYPIIDNLIYAYQRNGWTGLELTYGKNLFNTNFVHGIWASGIFYSHESSSSRYITTLDKIHVFPNTDYTISFNINRQISYYVFGLYNINGEFIEQIISYNGTVQTTDLAYFVTINVLLVDTITSITQIEISNVQLEKGTQVTPYEPYEPPTTDIASRLKLPLPHYFPHPVINALISAADGQHTEEEKEVLRHYLTPLGIGGI